MTPRVVYSSICLRVSDQLGVSNEATGHMVCAAGLTGDDYDTGLREQTASVSGRHRLFLFSLDIGTSRKRDRLFEFPTLVCSSLAGGGFR